MRADTRRGIAWGSAAATAGLCAVAIGLVAVRATEPDEAGGPAVAALALSAASVLLVAFGLPLFLRRLDIDLGRWFAWLVGAVSLSLAIAPWFLVFSGSGAWGAAVYRALRVPQGIEQFWDFALILRSVDCASYGFDVFAPHNGCLPEPSIYAPGTLWLQYVPFGLFSASNVQVLGVLAMVVSSLGLVWLARNTHGRGALVLLVAAAGAPWQLLLERGNFDAFLIWCAIAVVILVRRFPALWAWWLAAAAVWLMGTWKYYPFAMGLMLLPVLRRRRGWTVIVGYLAASVAFVMLTWGNFRLSMLANESMTNLGDYVVLGRVPVVTRMVEAVSGGDGWSAGDLLVLALAVAAALWGVMFGLSLRRSHVHEAMLASAGSMVFLSSVLVAGFAWGYKAAFLTLAVPLLALPRRQPARVMLYASVSMLSLTAVASVVVWNTVLATGAGIIVASFALGASLAILVSAVLRSQSAATQVTEEATATA